MVSAEPDKSETVSSAHGFVRVGSDDIYWQKWWSGPALGVGVPILLYHDSLGAVALWRDFPAVLAEATGRVVYAYDRAGFGRSSVRSDKLALGFVASEGRDVVPVLCDALGVTRFVACGHSVGGAMAIETAAHRPDLVEALVTIAAQTFAEDLTLQSIARAKIDFEDGDTLARLARYHGDKAEWVLEAWTGSWLSPGFADWSVDGALKKVTCPTLALHGENDEYGTDVHPRRIAALTGGDKLILADTGHVPHRECPEQLARLIAEFLES